MVVAKVLASDNLIYTWHSTDSGSKLSKYFCVTCVTELNNVGHNDNLIWLSNKS